jgi:glycosyltransferase involved in cell wall biosynthesis
LAIGYCGRFDPDKGVLELVEAVRSSRKSNGLELQLHLLGRGSLQETLARAQDEEPWIRLFEPVPHHQVPRFLQNLDMFVLPSRVSPDREEHDAHGLVEAMAVGLPCIGTRSGIIPQLLAGGAGFLVPANSTQELAQALATLATDPGKRASLGRKARETALANHALDSLAANKAAIFKRLGCT